MSEQVTARLYHEHHDDDGHGPHDGSDGITGGSWPGTSAHPEDFTVDEVATQLTTGYWGWSNNNPNSTQTFSWNVGPDDAIPVDISRLDAGGQAFALAAFEAWSNVSGIRFVQQSLSAGQYGMRFDDAEQNTAYATFSSYGGAITSAFVNVGTGWIDGDWYVDGSGDVVIDHVTYSFMTYIHEIGHAMGLGHGGNYNGNASYGVSNNYANDSWQMSVMSYFTQTENTTIDASFAYVTTPMIADIKAIQDLYGDAETVRLGDSVYGVGSNIGGYYDLLSTIGSDSTFTIIDDGGTDTLNFSFSTRDDHIDLAPGAISDVGGLRGNMVIYTDTVLENAIAGSGDDVIIGNASNNVLGGGAGDDTLSGGAGRDLLFGGGQAGDILTGGAGGDVFAFADRQGTVADYSFVGIDLADGTLNGDIIYLEGTGDHAMSVQNGSWMLDGISVQASSAVGNVAIANVDAGSISDAFSSGDLSAMMLPLPDLSIVVHDTGDAEAFHTASYTFAQGGPVSNIATLFDDGITLRQDFDVYSTRTWDSISTYETAGGDIFDERITYDTGMELRTISDTAAENVWTTIVEYRDDGGAMYDKRVNYDDSTQLRTILDTGSEFVWENIQEFRSADNALYDKRTNYDDGTQLRLVKDTAGIEDWVTLNEYRNANDALYDKRTNYDDGEQARLIFDIEEANSWSLINESRNIAGELFKKLLSYDDGKEQVILFDVGDAYAWDTYARVFDIDGSLLSENYA